MAGEGATFDGFPFGPIRLVKRGWSGRVPESQRAERDLFIVRRVGTPRDEGFDLDETEYGRAFQMAWDERKQDEGISEEEKCPTSIAQLRIPMRVVRPATRGLLLIYPLDPEGCSFQGAEGVPIVGFAVCFPTDEGAVRVGYEVNNVYWSQEFGSGE